jgi:hypothetical protein
MAYATEQGKEYALAELARRRELSKTQKKIDNSSLVAGSPMYYYCQSCGQLADCLPESHFNPPRKLCSECRALKDCGWLE